MLIYISLLVLSYLGFLLPATWGTPLMMMGGCYLALCLALKLMTTRPAWVWWTWAVQGMVLIGFYMASYGVANIVGSAQKFSARMAVSKLRTILWAQDQCISKTQRSCLLSELNGNQLPQGISTALLRGNFRTLMTHDQEIEIARDGQYFYAIYPMTPTWGEKSWIAYAWPAEDQTLQTFCLSYYEEILELIPRGYYVGYDKRPPADACLGSLHTNPNPPLTDLAKKMIEQGKKPPAPTHQATDQQTWQRWRGKRTRRAKASFP